MMDEDKVVAVALAAPPTICTSEVEAGEKSVSGV